MQLFKQENAFYRLKIKRADGDLSGLGRFRRSTD